MNFSDVYEKCTNGKKIEPGMTIKIKEIRVEELKTKYGDSKKTMITADDGSEYFSFSRIIAAQAGMILQVCGPTPEDLTVTTVRAKTDYGKFSVKFDDGQAEE